MSLLDEIQAGGFDLANRDDGAIAAALSVDRKKVVKTLGGIGMVLETLGPADGAALLDSLEAMSANNSAVKWAFVLVNRGELDFGSAATRAMIDMLIPPDAAAALKAIAEVPDVVTAQQVAQALEGL
jgi:hypothetical protein